MTDLTDNDYTTRVLGAVHQLRVDPFDEVTRLMLADLMEERNVPGVEVRTTRHLRDGKMVLNSLDFKLVSALLNISLESRGGYNARIADEEQGVLTSICDGQNLNMVVEPDIYRRLWAMAWRHKDKFLYNTKLLFEADAVHQDRMFAVL